MKSKSAWIILFLFILTLLLRKAGAGLSSLLILSTAAILIFTIIAKPFFFQNLYQRIFITLFLIICLALLQYWIFDFELNRTISNNLSLNFIFLTAWIILSIFLFKSVFTKALSIALWLFISFILITSVIFNPREFHNFYRSTPFEEYIRTKYPEKSGRAADLFIDKFKKVDKEKAAVFFNDALEAESKGEYEDALDYYNKSIDINPDDSYSNYRRGLLKLTRLELSLSIAASAVMDFNRSINLDSDSAVVYFHRSLALGYLGFRKETVHDLKKVWELDSTISDEEFRQKYGCSKKSFSVPLYP